MKVLKAWMVGDHIKTLKRDNKMNIVTLMAMDAADEATLQSVRDVKDLACGEGVESVNLEDLASKLWASKRTMIQVPKAPEDLQLFVNPRAGAGILDCMLEFETTSTIPRKQSDLTDFSLIQGVQSMMRSMEAMPAGPDEARLQRRMRYLGSFKRVGPKKDLYAITKAASSGVRSIITASATVNNCIRNFLQGLVDACHCEPLATTLDAYGWRCPGTSAICLMAVANPASKSCLFSKGETLLGGCANEYLLSVACLAGGAIELIAGDSCYLAQCFTVTLRADEAENAAERWRSMDEDAYKEAQEESYRQTLVPATPVESEEEEGLHRSETFKAVLSSDRVSASKPEEEIYIKAALGSSRC